MAAGLLLRKRLALSETAFVDLVVWHVPAPVPGSSHRFKYRLALVSNDFCVLRYDNESGKGDHRHIGNKEVPYPFHGLDALQSDFWTDVLAWRKNQ